MKYSDFAAANNINSVIKLKDGRTLYTTANGFKYWVEGKNKNRIDSISEEQYNKARLQRQTKKNK